MGLALLPRGACGGSGCPALRAHTAAAVAAATSVVVAGFALTSSAARFRDTFMGCTSRFEWLGLVLSIFPDPASIGGAEDAAGQAIDVAPARRRRRRPPPSVESAAGRGREEHQQVLRGGVALAERASELLTDLKGQYPTGLSIDRRMHDLRQFSYFQRELEVLHETLSEAHRLSMSPAWIRERKQLADELCAELKPLLAAWRSPLLEWALCLRWSCNSDGAGNVARGAAAAGVSQLLPHIGPRLLDFYGRRTAPELRLLQDDALRFTILAKTERTLAGEDSEAWSDFEDKLFLEMLCPGSTRGSRRRRARW